MKKNDYRDHMTSKRFGWLRALVAMVLIPCMILSTALTAVGDLTIDDLDKLNRLLRELPEGKILKAQAVRIADTQYTFGSSYVNIALDGDRILSSSAQRDSALDYLINVSALLASKEGSALNPNLFMISNSHCLYGLDGFVADLSEPCNVILNGNEVSLNLLNNQASDLSDIAVVGSPLQIKDTDGEDWAFNITIRKSELKVDHSELNLVGDRYEGLSFRGDLDKITQKYTKKMNPNVACNVAGHWDGDGKHHTRCKNCSKYMCQTEYSYMQHLGGVCKPISVCQVCQNPLEALLHKTLECGYCCTYSPKYMVNHGRCNGPTGCGGWKCDGKDHNGMACDHCKQSAGLHVQMLCKAHWTCYFAPGDSESNHNKCPVAGCGMALCDDSHSMLDCGRCCSNKELSGHEACDGYIGCGGWKCDGKDHSSRNCAHHCRQSAGIHNLLPCFMHWSCCLAPGEKAEDHIRCSVAGCTGFMCQGDHSEHTN